MSNVNPAFCKTVIINVDKALISLDFGQNFSQKWAVFAPCLTSDKVRSFAQNGLRWEKPKISSPRDNFLFKNMIIQFKKFCDSSSFQHYKAFDTIILGCWFLLIKFAQFKYYSLRWEAAKFKVEIAVESVFIIKSLYFYCMSFKCIK